MAFVARAWRTLIVAGVLSGLAVGYMEYERRQAQDKLAQLESQVNQASTKVNTMRDRERKANEAIVAVADLEARLLDLEDGAFYRQHLETMLNASRTSGTMLDRLTFAPVPSIGTFQAGSISGTVSGSEAQVLKFFQLLEEGAPLARVDKVNWLIRLEHGADGTKITGSANFQISLFGPRNPPRK